MCLQSIICLTIYLIASIFLPSMIPEVQAQEPPMAEGDPVGTSTDVPMSLESSSSAPVAEGASDSTYAVAGDPGMRTAPAAASAYARYTRTHRESPGLNEQSMRTERENIETEWNRLECMYPNPSPMAGPR